VNLGPLQWSHQGAIRWRVFKKVSRSISLNAALRHDAAAENAKEKFNGLQHRPFRKNSRSITGSNFKVFGLGNRFGAFGARAGADVVLNSLLRDREEDHANRPKYIATVTGVGRHAIFRRICRKSI